MKTAVCLYFQVHQPYRLNCSFDFFQIGSHSQYYDEKTNKKILQRVAKKCYLPANKIIQKLAFKYPETFRTSFSISGTALDQFEEFAPEVLESFKNLSRTNCIEFLSETYYHSLAFNNSPTEFNEQVNLHTKKIESLFNQTPETFRNTELIFNNDLAHEIEKLGFKTILCEGTEKSLKWRSPNFLYTPKGCTNLKLLTKNYYLSDDIAFRFSNKHSKNYPLTPEKYLKKLENLNDSGAEVINLFMDYETFGEHHWPESGILTFLESLLEKIQKSKKLKFLTPSVVSKKLESYGEIDIENFTSWADRERDLSAWQGNPLQNAATKFVYEIEKKVKRKSNSLLLDEWRKLTTSDHFYYICTKNENDGDVHNYFNPFGSAHDAFLTYSNVLNDFSKKVDSLNKSY